MNKTTQRLGLALIASLLVASAAFAQQQSQSADYIVAVVNSDPITQRELMLQTLRTEQRMAAQGAAIPPRATLLKEVLERLISEKVQLQEAIDTGLKVSDPEVEETLLAVASQNGLSVSQLLARLKDEGVTAAKFRADLRDELLISRLREREFDRRIRISDSEVNEHIRQQHANSNAATAIDLNLAQILIALPEGADKATAETVRAKAEAVRARALRGEDFNALAEQASANFNKGAGVTLGLKNAGRYPEAFVAATQGLGVGKVSALVPTEAGFFILKVLEKRVADLPPMTVTQTRARHILLKTSAQLPEAQAVRKLADIKQQILNKQASFESMAKAHSQDGSAEHGGDLGWVAPGRFVPEFENVMNQLRPGILSAPVVSRFGVHLLEVMDRRQVQVSADEQREVVRNQMREQKTQELFPTWLAELRGNAYVEYRQAPQN